MLLASDPERLAHAVNTVDQEEVVLRSDDIETIVAAVPAITADAEGDLGDDDLVA